ncbi:MAG: TonB-dependent receptor, partial [Steroidobacter sp.]|nr:TonB-dependent receptor [Steroidobacter sp.]
QVYGAVTNLLDEKYYTPAFDWLALVQNANPGRTFRLGMSVKL